MISVVGLCMVIGVGALAGEPSSHKPERKETTRIGSIAIAPAATVGDASISMAELNALAESKLTRLRADEFAIKRRILEERIQALMFEGEARRSSMSVDDLLKSQIDDKTKPVTSEEARAVYESSRERMAPNLSEEETIRQITTSMFKQRVVQRRTEYVNELHAKHDVQVFLEPPRIRVRATGGPSRGPETAPITIVEFTDFQCPFCSRAMPTLQSLEEKFGQKVRLVFKHYPLPIHKEANRAAEAAVCAEEQGRFWEMHDKLFTDPNRLSATDIARYAQESNIEPSRFNDCLASGRGAERVKLDRAEGEDYGVSNTPTFFVNGRFLLGAVPLGTFASVVEEELQRLSTTPRKYPIPKEAAGPTSR